MALVTSSNQTGAAGRLVSEHKDGVIHEHVARVTTDEVVLFGSFTVYVLARSPRT
jgi:hypothetical protein